MNTPHVLSGGRYPVLRSLAIVYVLFAGVLVLAALVAAAYVLFALRFGLMDRLIMLVATVTVGFFMVISSLAVAEMLKLFIDIEHNTRMGMTPQVPVSTISTEAARSDGGAINRITALDEETAEAALLRGH